MEFSVAADAFLDLPRLAWLASLLFVDLFHFAQLSLPTLIGFNVARGFAQ